MSKWFLGYPYLGERELTDDEREKLKVLVQKVKKQRRIAWIVGIASFGLIFGAYVSGRLGVKEDPSWSEATLLSIGILGFLGALRLSDLWLEYTDLTQLIREAKLSMFGDAGSGQVRAEMLAGTSIMISLNSELLWQRTTPGPIDVSEIRARLYPTPRVEAGQRRIYFVEAEELRTQASRPFDSGYVISACLLISNIRWIVRAIDSGEYPQLTVTSLFALLCLAHLSLWFRDRIRCRKFVRDLESGRMLVSQNESGEVIEVLAESGKVWTRNGIPEPWRYLKA